MTTPLWVDALLSGDQRSWRQFRTAHPGARPAALPEVTAGQLACARSLIAAHPQLPRLDALLGVVLSTPAAGRGTVDLPPVGAHAPGGRPSWGPPAVEPEDVSAAETLRVAVPVLARLLPRAAGPSAAPRTPLMARRFVVHGAPEAARAVAEALSAAGWVHGPFRATHVVLGCPPDCGVEQVWSRRVASGGTRGWRRTWRVLHGGGALPAPLDVAALAARVAAQLPARARASRLRVVVGSDTAAAVDRALAALGLQGGTPSPPLDPATVDLHRRLNALPQRTAPRDTGWVRRVAPAAPGGGSGVPLGVPGRHRSWAAAQGDRLALEVDRLARHADYPVLGDPASLARLRPVGAPTRIDPAATLDRALTAIASAWQAGGGDAAGDEQREG